MTTRYSGFIVALSQDMREDDLEAVLTALRMIKGVMRVEPLMPDSQSSIAEMRRDQAWKDSLMMLLKSGPDG